MRWAIRVAFVRPVHWGRLSGFVLQGSIPQLQVGDLQDQGVRFSAEDVLQPKECVRLPEILRQSHFLGVLAQATEQEYFNSTCLDLNSSWPRRPPLALTWVQDPCSSTFCFYFTFGLTSFRVVLTCKCLLDGDSPRDHI